jgi:hypothetical protein
MRGGRSPGSGWRGSTYAPEGPPSARGSRGTWARRRADGPRGRADGGRSGYGNGDLAAGQTGAARGTATATSRPGRRGPLGVRQRRPRGRADGGRSGYGNGDLAAGQTGAARGTATATSRPGRRGPLGVQQRRPRGRADGGRSGYGNGDLAAGQTAAARDGLTGLIRGTTTGKRSCPTGILRARVRRRPKDHSYFLVRKAVSGAWLASCVRFGDWYSRDSPFTSRVTSSYDPAEPSTHRSLAMTPKPTQRSMPLGPR